MLSFAMVAVPSVCGAAAVCGRAGFQVVYVGPVRRRWTRRPGRQPRRSPRARRPPQQRGPPRPGRPRQPGAGSAGTTCEDRGVLLGLGLQRTRETGDLGDRGVEQVDGLGQRGEHGARQLAQQHLARLEVGQLGDLGSVEGLAVQDTALDDKSGVCLGKVTQTLGGLDHVSIDEGDGGRAGQQVVEAFDPRLGGGDLGERVLDHGVAGVLAEGAPQVLQLLHGETAVLGQHSAGGIVERVNDLRNGGSLLWPRHGSPSGVDHRRPAHRRRTPRAQAQGVDAARPLL